jgi:hypothetical protein
MQGVRTRAEITEPFANLSEWGMHALQARGGFEAFMEVMNPAFRSEQVK